MITYYKELLSYISKNVSNKDFAKDIAQETFEKAISFQNQALIENKRAFLYKLAKNIIIDEARKNKNIKVIPYEDNTYTSQSEETQNLVLEQEKQKILIQELKKLPLKRKEAFYLHIFEGYSRKEVAMKMGISIAAVEKHISRASIELKETIKRKES